jgi:hypothetical protein
MCLRCCDGSSCENAKSALADSRARALGKNGRGLSMQVDRYRPFCQKLGITRAFFDFRMLTDPVSMRSLSDRLVTQMSGWVESNAARQRPPSTLNKVNRFTCSLNRRLIKPCSAA